MDVRLSGPFSHDLPARAVPGQDELHFWLEDLRSWDDPCPADHNVLALDEKIRRRKFRFPRDRRRYVLSRKFLRLNCARYLGVQAADIGFSLGRYGKPYLTAPSSGSLDLRFSISHSGDILLAAFKVGREVGVDIETGDTRFDIAAMSEICCSPIEKLKLQSLDAAGRLNAFLRNWTLKEAYTKALGVGHQQPFQEIEASVFASDRPFVKHLVNSDAPPGSWLAFEPNLAPLVGFAAAIVYEGTASGKAETRNPKLE